MSNHVKEWLNAYLDGELKGRQLHQVEEHLSECEACQAEFESLQGLSSMLHEIHAPTLVSHERFISQVNLRLSERRVKQASSGNMGLGWWLIPVTLMAAWIFVSTASLLGNVVSAADTFGLLDSKTAAWIASPSDTADVTATLGQVGVLKGESLQRAGSTEGFIRNTLPQVVLQVSVALLYLIWLAVWWARQMRQVNGQLLES